VNFVHGHMLKHSNLRTTLISSALPRVKLLFTSTASLHVGPNNEEIAELSRRLWVFVSTGSATRLSPVMDLAFRSIPSLSVSGKASRKQGVDEALSLSHDM